MCMHTHAHTEVFLVSGVAFPGHRLLFVVVTVHTEATRRLYFHRNFVPFGPEKPGLQNLSV